MSGRQRGVRKIDKRRTMKDLIIEGKGSNNAKNKNI
jgi:hypothetical protein